MLTLPRDRLACTRNGRTPPSNVHVPAAGPSPPRASSLEPPATEEIIFFVLMRSLSYLSG
jgi:hypothetical protein